MTTTHASPTDRLVELALGLTLIDALDPTDDWSESSALWCTLTDGLSPQRIAERLALALAACTDRETTDAMWEALPPIALAYLGPGLLAIDLVRMGEPVCDERTAPDVIRSLRLLVVLDVMDPARRDAAEDVVALSGCVSDHDRVVR